MEFCICQVDQWTQSSDLAYQKVGRAVGFLGLHAHCARSVRRGKKIMTPWRPSDPRGQLGHAQGGLGRPLAEPKVKLG